MPYPVTLVHDDAEWVASVDALPGCTARGATRTKPWSARPTR